MNKLRFLVISGLVLSQVAPYAVAMEPEQNKKRKFEESSEKTASKRQKSGQPAVQPAMSRVPNLTSLCAKEFVGKSKEQSEEYIEQIAKGEMDNDFAMIYIPEFNRGAIASEENNIMGILEHEGFSEPVRVAFMHKLGKSIPMTDELEKQLQTIHDTTDSVKLKDAIIQYLPIQRRVKADLMKKTIISQESKLLKIDKLPTSFEEMCDSELLSDCAISADGASLAITTSLKNTEKIQIWEKNNDNVWCCVETLTGHTQSVNSVAWSVQGTLATGSTDTTVKIWEKNNNNVWRCVETLTGHTKRVISVAWSPGGRYLATRSWDGTVKIWEKNNNNAWNCVAMLPAGHGFGTDSVAWSVDGTLAITDYNKIKIWAKSESSNNAWYLVTTKHCGNEGNVQSVTWSVDGALASRDNEKRIKICKNNGNLWELFAHVKRNNTVTPLGVTWLEDGILAVVQNDGKIDIVMITNKFHGFHKLIATLNNGGIFSENSGMNSIKCSANGILMVAYQQGVLCWDIRLLQSINRYAFSSQEINLIDKILQEQQLTEPEQQQIAQLGGADPEFGDALRALLKKSKE